MELSPDRVIDNNELAKLVDTSDDWIKQRTGIEKRHVVADGELTLILQLKPRIERFLGKYTS